MESVDSDYFVLRAGFLFEKKVSERFKYSVGVGYSDDYGQLRVLPVVRLRWKSGQSWDFDLDIPSKARAWYNLSPRVRLGLVAKVTGGHFRVGEAVEVENGNTEKGRVKYSILNFGPAVGYSIYKGAYLTFNTGFSLFRRFQLFDVNDNKLEQSDYETSLFFKTTIDYNVGG